MNKSPTSEGDRSDKRIRRGHSGSEVQYLLGAEEWILQSISNRAPLPGVLDGICCALDCQIGNVVSFISFPGDDASELAAISMSATLFDLHAFCSKGVLSENDELLGSLEMYCSVCRSPSAREFQLIERAACLVAIAIKLDNEVDHRCDCGISENRPVPGDLLEWPVFVN